MSPGNIRAKFMQRDFDYDEDDNFQVALSTFNDNRNGYLFIINPNGARADLLISSNEEANKDWNGVWDCKTSVTNEGWFAELRDVPRRAISMSVRELMRAKEIIVIVPDTRNGRMAPIEKEPDLPAV